MENTISQNWDLDSLYTGGAQSKQLRKSMNNLKFEIEELIEQVKALNTLGKNYNFGKLLDIFQGTQKVMSGSLEVDDFLICVYSENVEDSSVSNLLSLSAEIKSNLTSLQAEIDHILINLPEQVWLDFSKQKEVEPYLFYLKERREAVKNKLPLEMEKMISKLSVNGFIGWEQHYEQMLAKLKIPIVVEGKEENVSIGHALYQAVYATDRSIRQRAAQSIRQVCEKNADAFASVLNHIAGFRLDVYQQRGWDNVLKEALDQNRIKEESLQTMVSTIKQYKDLTRAFIKRKLEIKKLETAAWYDVEYPSFSTEEKVTYQEAINIITTQFRRFSGKLGDFAEKAFKEGWIEAEDRSNKAEGGFCASMPLAKESRIFLTYRGSYQDVVTIAHELGHAYHNQILHEEPAFAQETGTSVAETASTFMENLVLDAAIESAESLREKLALLEMKITNGLKYVAAVPNMFEFELKLYERRQKGLLTADEIKNLMSEAENDIYGGLIEEVEPYRWIYISHFYDTEKAFYNIPYTIGYLFSNGIYALAKEQGDSFLVQYDELLRNSGRMTVEQLADVYLNKNLIEKDFWEASLQPVKEAIDEYLLLTEEMV